MNDDAFLKALRKKNILPGDVKNNLKQFSDASEKASYFIENVIKKGFDRGDDSCFTNLLAAMKESRYGEVKDLAEEIKNKLGMS